MKSTAMHFIGLNTTFFTSFAKRLSMHEGRNEKPLNNWKGKIHIDKTKQSNTDTICELVWPNSNDRER